MFRWQGLRFGVQDVVDEALTEAEEGAPRRRRWRHVLLSLIVLLLTVLVAALVALWLFRVRIATDYIDQEFARRGVQASYDVKRIGLGTQVFENLRIGDPRNPDLVARRVEVGILIGFNGPRVGLITARGVRLRGRLVDGEVSFGQLDRLLPERAEPRQPFRLPNQRVDIADAQLLLDTPAGRIAAALEGRGNLAFDFTGRTLIRSDQLALGACTLVGPSARLAIAIEDEQPRLTGPVALQRLGCGDTLDVAQPRFQLRARLSESFAGWRGVADLEASRLRAGLHRLAGIGGRVSFAGNAERTVGDVRLEAAAGQVAGFGAGRSRFAGRYALGPRSGAIELDGRVAVAGLQLPQAQVASVAGVFRALSGTPVAAVGEALAQAVIRAGHAGSTAEADLRLLSRSGRGAVRLGNLQLASRSGARIRSGGGRGITYSWPRGGVQLDGAFALGGGGLPEARFVLAQPRPGAPITGRGRVAPMAVGRSRLALGELRFQAGGGGLTRLDTIAEATGPFGAGFVERLRLPLRAQFGPGVLTVNPACTPAAFARLTIGNFRFGPGGFSLCPVGPALVWRDAAGRVRVATRITRPRLGGLVGGSPISLAAAALRLDLTGQTFAAESLATQIGPRNGGVRLKAGRLAGRFLSGGNLAGTFAGLDGDIVNVPLLVEDAGGQWSLEGGALRFAGRLQVRDQADPPRFRPLISNDFRLLLADNRIRAEGWLAHPGTGTPVTQAKVVHDLGTGAGNAVLDVPALRFTRGFQPDDLTRLTVGVVALVEGSVTGQGRIEWDGQGTRSTGSFATADMNLAAPFGPVEGLTTRIQFTDLLGLTSAPGQEAQVDLVRAGIDVFDGRIHYQLLPRSQVNVEQGVWPFVGGRLVLDSTLLDFGQTAAKRLTFRVEGADAARFVQQLGFANISVTGTFDGVVPMVFDQTGGRVIGGRLQARDPGGTLAYVGELTDRDLGIYGKLAFDALKSLRYSRLDIGMDGALAGEFVTTIGLDGIARDPQLGRLRGGGISGVVARRTLSQLARIPFRFNIRVAGPFRAILGTARSFDDPSLLIQPVLPRLLRDGTTTTVRNVQPQESEPVR